MHMLPDAWTLDVRVGKRWGYRGPHFFFFKRTKTMNADGKGIPRTYCLTGSKVLEGQVQSPDSPGACSGSQKAALPHRPPFPVLAPHFSSPSGDMCLILGNSDRDKVLGRSSKPGWVLVLERAGCSAGQDSSLARSLVPFPPGPSGPHLPHGCRLLSIWSSYQKHGEQNMTNGDKWKERSHKGFKVDHQQIYQQL